MVDRRMSSRRVVCVFAASILWILLATSCGKQTPPDTRAADEAALRDVDAQWAKTAATKDVDATIAFYSDDAIVLPPNAPLATGKAAIHGVWAELLAPDTSLSWQATKVEIARSGDLGYVTGTYVATSKDPKGKPVTEEGKFVEVWKKQADGKWKAIVDTYNSDLAPQAPPPPQKSKAHHSSKKKNHAKHHSSGM